VAGIFFVTFCVARSITDTSFEGPFAEKSVFRPEKGRSPQGRWPPSKDDFTSFVAVSMMNTLWGVRQKVGGHGNRTLYLHQTLRKSHQYTLDPAVLEEDAWKERLTAIDLRALSPLKWQHMNP
jgi:hypothetical protein